MTKKWKIAIIILFILMVWIRLAPAIKWTLESINRINSGIKEGYYKECQIQYNWSWWSLRFTNVYPKCSR